MLQGAADWVVAHPALADAMRAVFRGRGSAEQRRYVDEWVKQRVRGGFAVDQNVCPSEGCGKELHHRGRHRTGLTPARPRSVSGKLAVRQPPLTPEEAAELEGVETPGERDLRQARIEPKRPVEETVCAIFYRPVSLGILSEVAAEWSDGKVYAEADALIVTG